MNPVGVDYLHKLAALSLSFVGFSAIVVTVRRALGGELAEGHVRLVRLFLETGLAVTALSLLPTLLTFLGVPEVAMWRVASAVAGSLLTLLMIVQFRRRRRIEGRFPPWVVAVYLTSVAAVLALWLNVIGIPYGPSVAPYAVSLTWSLFVSGYIFLRTLDVFLRILVGRLSGRGPRCVGPYCRRRLVRRSPKGRRRNNLLSLISWRSLIVRKLDRRVVSALKARAASRGRSAEAEHRAILEHALLGAPPEQDFKAYLRSMPDGLDLPHCVVLAIGAGACGCELAARHKRRFRTATRTARESGTRGLVRRSNSARPLSERADHRRDSTGHRATQRPSRQRPRRNWIAG